MCNGNGDNHTSDRIAGRIMQVAHSHHAATTNNNSSSISRSNNTNSTGQPNTAAQSMASLASASSSSSNASTASTSSSSTSSLSSFSEQVGLVINLFQDWNDCERSVSLFAVLKRIPFSCTKFMQSVIDANLAQTFAGDGHSKQLERNANSGAHVRWLHETYRGLDGDGVGGGGGKAATTRLGYVSSGSTSSCMNGPANREPLFGDPETSRLAPGHAMQTRPTPMSGASRRGSAPPGSDASRYERKEDVLNDILTLLPILTPGNDEAKSAYLEVIPAAVDDAIRGTVNTTLVQQIFSYVLIHPAFTADDRR